MGSKECAPHHLSRSEGHVTAGAAMVTAGQDDSLVEAVVAFCLLQ